MFESLFEFFFKYRPLIFQQGDFALRTNWVGYVAVVVAGVAAFLTLRTYAQVRGNSQPMDRTILTAIRIAALAVLVFCLLRPVLVLSSVVPQENFLGVLVDDSRSMQIADTDDTPRQRFVDEHFGNPDSELMTALSDRFALRFFSFANDTDRVGGVDELAYSGTRTHLGQALERAHEELSGVPLSGLVVVTDGADNAEGGLGEALLPLQASGVPIFAVGLGREEYDRDIQMSRVETPRRVLKGASLAVELVVTHRGYQGETVTVQVEDEGRIVGTEDIQLAADGDPQTVRIRFTANEEGPRLYSFRVSPRPDEMVTQNNLRQALIVVEDRHEKILYFEGEPRWEVKYLLRGVEEDENLQVVLLQRTAENKFLRRNVDGPDELVGGFPRTRSELFDYQGLILGSIEAGHFTPDQLRMIADFVNHRGGGLLMLGSHRSFAEGGYAGTPVGDVLPVVLDGERADGEESFFQEVSVETTRAGATHPSTLIADSESDSVERWRTLPPVTIVNPITEVKPGATTLLTTPDDLVVLAFQRYGAGKSMAFPVQDSWMWQMHADVPVEDLTHETYWRRLLRWLVDGVPEQVTANVPQDRVEPEELVTVLAEVGDENYEELNNSSVVALVSDPAGNLTELPMEWTAEKDGEYRATFTASEEGFYEVRVEAAVDEELLGQDTVYVQVAPSDSEFYDSTMRAPLLERVAEETGGRFYTPDTVASLADDIQYVGGGVTVVEQRDLWDMPALLLLLMTLVLGEWGYRRYRGSGVKSLRLRRSRPAATPSRVVCLLICAAALSVLSTGRAEAQQTHLLVITGLGGDPEYTQQFHDWATTLVDTATTRYELPPDNVTYLGEKPDLAPGVISGRSLRENVEAAVHAIADRAEPRDHVVIVLFGHGSFTDAARINLPRRDLSAEEFADLLSVLDRQQVTFVNTASASGPFVEKLSGAGRTVMTATKTGGERNASVFGGYFVAAFGDGEGDADQNKDQRVSMLEAFIYAKARVAQVYETEGLLMTEHALLDDNGDGEGSDAPDPLAGDDVDGIVARTLFFTSGVGRRAEQAFPDDPELQALYQEQAELEARVDDLRRLRGGADPEQYQQELERLMIDLALKSRQIRELESARSVPQNR